MTTMKRLLNTSRRLPSCFTGIQKRFKTDEIPPLLLYTTASPHVFVSSAAIDQSPDGGVHPKSLFTESKPPRSFLSSTFKYISPAKFNFELPGVDEQVPEIAFLGRSNVGKSSLLNALTTKDLAKTSKTPGRTQQVNYFGLYPSHQSDGDGDPLGYIIDLPGKYVYV
jgi:GTP-binding protein EngB required for normal cell division